jgi:hypothetical protein
MGLNMYNGSIAAAGKRSVPLATRHGGADAAGGTIRQPRNDLYDVVQHTCMQQQPEVTGGDSW